MNLYNKPPPSDYVLRYCKPSPQEYLAHHGILGQRWGKRNGPPYPLGANDHSASERKAGWRKSLDKTSGESDNKEKAQGENSEKKGLTSRQKKAIVAGVAAAAVALAVIGGYQLKKSGKLDPLIELGKQKVTRLFQDSSVRNQKCGSFWDFIKKEQTEQTEDPFRSLEHAETIREAVRKANPDGGDENCRSCAIATVLRMRGLDVEALSSDHGGFTEDAVKACFKKAKVKYVRAKNKQDITSYILSQFPEGSNGILGATFRSDNERCRHAISWAVKGGKVLFFDGQSACDDCSYYFAYLLQGDTVEIARLDHLELKQKSITKFIRERHKSDQSNKSGPNDQ